MSKRKPAEWLTKEIWSDIERERDRQDAQWGGPDHDAQHDAFDWCNYVHKQLGLINTEATVDRGAHTFRARMVKVAALAIASIEAYDRRKLG